MREAIHINSRRYSLARQSLLPSGARQWAVSARPSQPGDPTEAKIAEWRLGEPALFSVEADGYLGTAYTQAVDHRFPGRLCLGPLLNSVTLSDYDATYTNTPVDSTYRADVDLFLDGSPVAGDITAMVKVPGPSTEYLYILRGQFVSKVNLATMALVDDTHILPEAGTSMILTYTEVPDQKPELSVAMEGQPYHVMNQVGGANTLDNWVVNSGTYSDGETVTTGYQAIARILGVSPKAVRLLHENHIWSNVLTGSVTMATPNITPLDIIRGPKLTPTGFELDGTLDVLFTDHGPYMLDPEELQFFPLMPELDPNLANGAAHGTWFSMGVLIGLASGSRYQRGGAGSSFGPEVFQGNRTPLQGAATGFAGWERWLYSLVSGTDGSEYLVAYDPRVSDRRSPAGRAPYTISYGTDLSRILYIGTVRGLRSRRTAVMGSGTSTLLWFIIGNDREELDDTSYEHAASGTWYGTEMTRNNGSIVTLEWIQTEVSGASASEVVTLAVVVTNDAGTATTVTLNGGAAAVNSTVVGNGRARRLFVNDSLVPLSTVSGVRIAPQISFARGGTATASPVVRGSLLIGYRERPFMTKVIEFTVVLDATQYDSSLNGTEELLLATWSLEPLAVVDDIDGASYYGKVESVKVVEVQERGGGRDNDHTAIRLAQVRMAVVPTTGGS